MKILVINAGSSSLKYQLIDMENESVLAKGNCERIGIDGGIVTHKLPDGRSKEMSINMDNHTQAFMKVKDMLLDKEVLLNSHIVPNGDHCEACWEKQIPFFMDTLLYSIEKA